MELMSRGHYITDHFGPYRRVFLPFGGLVISLNSWLVSCVCCRTPRNTDGTLVQIQTEILEI